MIAPVNKTLDNERGGDSNHTLSPALLLGY